MTDGTIDYATAADSSDMNTDGTNLGRHVLVLGGVHDAGF